MKPRCEFTIDGGGRLFKKTRLESYRKELCTELRRVGRTKLAERYEQMSLETFGTNGGYVIVDKADTR